MCRPHKGFTLIELLVVIAIIGVLSSVVLASLNTARSRANDAKRVSDLRQLVTALELYRSSNPTYPDHASDTQVDTSLSGVLNPTYIPTIPTDPKWTGSSGYRYCRQLGGGGYTMLAYLERTSNWCSMTMGGDACFWSTTYPQC